MDNFVFVRYNDHNWEFGLGTPHGTLSYFAKMYDKLLLLCGWCPMGLL